MIDGGWKHAKIRIMCVTPVPTPAPTPTPTQFPTSSPTPPPSPNAAREAAYADEAAAALHREAESKQAEEQAYTEAAAVQISLSKFDARVRLAAISIFAVGCIIAIITVLWRRQARRRMEEGSRAGEQAPFEMDEQSYNDVQWLYAYHETRTIISDQTHL